MSTLGYRAKSPNVMEICYNPDVILTLVFCCVLVFSMGAYVAVAACLLAPTRGRCSTVMEGSRVTQSRRQEEGNSSRGDRDGASQGLVKNVA